MLVINESDFSTATLQEEGNAFLDTLASTVVGSEIQVDIVSMPAISTTGLTDAELRASPVPVSGTVTANTGLTQPVTDTQLRATPVDVNVTGGSFGDATAANQTAQTALLTTIDGDTSNLDVALSTRLKPADTLTGVTTVGTITNVVHVDDNAGSITVDAPVATPVFVRLSDGAAAISALPITDNGSSITVDFTTTGSGTASGALRVELPTNGTGTVGLNAGTNAIGKLAANSGVDIGDVDVTSIVMPTLTKGTQGSTGLSVQNLKDAGRTNVRYYATAVAAGTTGTETAITLTKSSGTSATSTGTSFTPTSGKTFRIEAITFATRGHNTATAQVTTFNFRINTAGAVTTSSTPIILAMRSATPATANSWDRVFVTIPDGLEIPGDGTLQFGVTAAATYTTNAPTWDVTIIGFEY